MKIAQTKIPGVLIIDPDTYKDARGYFLEIWNIGRYSKMELPYVFVQDNLSHSKKGTLRGLHFQNPNPQGKLVCVLQGEVFDVAVDIRSGSPTFGQWVGVVLSCENHRQLFIPPGFAHGFCVMSDIALFAYKCTELYEAHSDSGLAWDDPDIGIEWPVSIPILSEKDKKSPRLRDLAPERLPVFHIQEAQQDAVNF